MGYATALQKVKLSNRPPVSDNWLSRLASACPAIEALELTSGTPSGTGAFPVPPNAFAFVTGLDEVLTRCGRLTSLAVEIGWGSYAKSFAFKCARLHQISLDFCPRGAGRNATNVACMDDAQVTSMLHGCAKLERLCMRNNAYVGMTGSTSGVEVQVVQ